MIGGCHEFIDDDCIPEYSIGNPSHRKCSKFVSQKEKNAEKAKHDAEAKAKADASMKICSAFDKNVKGPVEEELL